RRQEEHEKRRSPDHRAMYSKDETAVSVLSRALAALAALLLILSASSPGPSEDDAFGAEYAPLVSAIKTVVKEQTIGD
ncbi:unnamed protein product, partial [marine sediment metagenome]